MRARWYLFVVGLLVAAGGVIVIALREPSTASSTSAASHFADAGRSTPSLASPAHAASPSTTQRLSAQRIDALAIEWNDASHDVVGPVIEGTLVVVDQDGGSHAEEDGSFISDFIDGEDSVAETGDPDHASRRVAVKHGRFRFDACHATAMLVEQLELGGRVAVVEREVELAAGESLTLAAAWAEDVLLHVVDARTHAELADVTVARQRDPLDPAPEHPGQVQPVDIVLAHARSPFHLTRATATQRAILNGPLWVGASGRAWQFASPDFAVETERTIELGAAGSLVVKVTDVPEPSFSDARSLLRWNVHRIRLRLRRPNGFDAARGSGAPNASDVLIADLAAHPDETRIDGLEPGELLASIEIGDPCSTPNLLSLAPATIRTGETARVELSLDPAMAPKAATLSGTLYIPKAWRDEELQLEAEPIHLHGATRPDQHRIAVALDDEIEDRPGWHCWSTTPILAGTYDFFVERTGFRSRVEVGPDGRGDVTLVLPEPALLKVRVMNPETKRAVDLETLRWIPSSTRSASASADLHSRFRKGIATMLTWDQESERYIAAVQPGRGTIVGNHAWSLEPGVDGRPMEYSVEAGDNELVVNGIEPCGVDIEVVRTDASIGSISIEWSRAGATDPDAYRIDFLGSSEHWIRFDLPGPGRYRFTRERSNGVAGAVLLEVDVPKGEFVKRTIELQKE